jgi:hypothetical protein
MWRVFEATDLIDGDLERQAHYEVTFFIFFFLANCGILAFKNFTAYSFSVLRVGSIGILTYMLVLGIYTNFTALNNLRIVDMSNNKQYYFPNSGLGPLSDKHQRMYLGGLILAWFSAFFGLLSTLDAIRVTNISRIGVVAWAVSLIILIPGLIITWVSNAADYDPADPNHRVAQNLLFQITTFTMLEWVVLTVGLFTAANDLLGASAFIFGVGSLAIPVFFFQIENFYQPSDNELVYAGPTLCWAASWVMFLSAVASQTVMVDTTAQQPTTASTEPKSATV